jgi:hypothetical protein
LIKVESAIDYITVYTVPSNKCLVIDAIQFYDYPDSALEVVATNGVVFRMTRQVNGTPYYINGEFYSLNRSVKLPSEVVLRARKTGSAYPTNSICIYGSLVDAQDLYAQATPTIKDLSVLLGGQTVSLTASIGGLTVVRVEQRTDLIKGDWTTAATVATDVTKDRTVTLTADTASSRFYRLTTLAR